MAEAFYDLPVCLNFYVLFLSSTICGRNVKRWAHQFITNNADSPSEGSRWCYIKSHQSTVISMNCVYLSDENLNTNSPFLRLKIL